MNPDSLVYIKLVSILAAAAGTFGMAYFSRRRAWFAVWLGVFVLSAIAVVQSSGLFVFAMGWEGITVAVIAMLLLGSHRATIIYGVVQMSGMALLLIGFAQVAGEVGMASLWASEAWAFNLWLLAGFAIKSGVLGVHQWLPLVHGTAPAPVSALLSGFTVVLGIWGLLRVVAEPSYVVMVWGLGQAIYGGARAIGQRDLKKLLAYSTISHVGLMLVGVGIGTDAARHAVVVHAVGHGLFKGLMFLTAGYIEKKHQIRDLYRLQQIQGLPWVVFLCLILGTLGLAGVPFFAGYPGKALLGGAAKGEAWVRVAMDTVSFLSAVYGGRILLLFFARKEESPVGRYTWSGALPPTLLFGLSVVGLAALTFGVAPGTWLGNEWSSGSLYSPQKLLSTVAFLGLGGCGAWLLERKGETARRALSPVHIRYAAGARVWFRRGLRWVRDLHNGDITRYLQWFLVTAVVILMLLRLGTA